MPSAITIKNGEGKWIKFTITENDIAVDVSTWTFRFSVKKSLNDTTYKIDKTSGDFNMAEAADGIVKCDIADTETTVTLMPPGDYVAEFRYTATATTDVGKSVTIPFIVEKSVMHD